MRSRGSPREDLAAELVDHLTDTLRIRWEIKTRLVEAAFRAVPRHLLVDRSHDRDRVVKVDPRSPTPTQLKRIYSDEALVSHRRRKIPTSSTSQPALVAQMLEACCWSPGCRSWRSAPEPAGTPR